jgi:YfiH family protein
MHFPDPFYRLHEHAAIDLPGAHAVFTTRRGGHSGGPYASLNLGLKTDDAPDRVLANEQRLEELVGVRIARCHQVHGTEIVAADSVPVKSPQADGQITTTPGVAPMVLVADCLPIVLAAPGAVVVLHAGWRGLAAGIIDRGVRALRDAGAQGPVAAAIGPGVGGCCYEVGPEVHAAFADYGSEVRDGPRIDLKAVAARALARAGVGQTHDVGLCTMCSDQSLFFSHRRDRGVTGRQAGVAWLS